MYAIQGQENLTVRMMYGYCSNGIYGGKPRGMKGKPYRSNKIKVSIRTAICEAMQDNLKKTLVFQQHVDLIWWTINIIKSQITVLNNSIGGFLNIFAILSNIPELHQRRYTKNMNSMKSSTFPILPVIKKSNRPGLTLQKSALPNPLKPLGIEVPLLVVPDITR